MKLIRLEEIVLKFVFMAWPFVSVNRLFSYLQSSVFKTVEKGLCMFSYTHYKDKCLQTPDHPTHISILLKLSPQR